MEDSASLTMLKKVGTKSAPDAKQELEKTPVTQTAQTEDEVTVDVDAMSSEELDALVKQQEIDTPIEWTSWDAAGKRGWLKEQFSEDGEAAADAPAAAPVAEAPKAEEPKPAKGKGKAKSEPKASEPKVSEPKVSEPKVTEPKAEAAPAEAAQATEAAPTGGTLTGKTSVADPPTSQTPKKGKGKKGADVATAAKAGEIVEADVLQDMVHEIENLKEEKAHKLISELMEETEVTFFRLGGILSVVQANGWYQPYASFREFVEQKHGLSYRKAIYWIEIYNRLSNSGIPWAKVKDVGWTKLQIIASVLTTENVDEWVTVAGAQNTLTLTETVKNAKAKANGSGGALEDQTAKTVTTMTFKVHSDQKAVIDAAIDKAKSTSGTTVSTAALEFIAQDYLGGQTLIQRAKTVGAEAWLKAAEEAFPGLNIEVTMADEEGEGDADKAA